MRRLLPLLAAAALIGPAGSLYGTWTTPGRTPVSRVRWCVQGPYKVSHITDGDTIDVLIGRTSTVIRRLGIDTPETKKPNVAVQCYGPEASARTTQLLSDQSVWLEPPTQLRPRTTADTQFNESVGAVA